MKNWFDNSISDAQIFDAALEIYKVRFKSIMGYQLLFFIIMLLVTIGGSMLLMLSISWLAFANTFFLAGFIFFLLFFIGVFTGINKAGIFHMVYGYIHEEDVSASEALGKAFGSLKEVVKMVLLLMLCISPVILTLILMEIDGTKVSMWISSFYSRPLLNFLLNVIFLSALSGLLGSYLLYSLHIAIFEQEPSVEAIKKSIKLAKGEVLRNVFRFFSLSMVQWIVNISLYIGFALILGTFYFLLGKIDAGKGLIAQVILVSEKIEPFIKPILGLFLEPIGSIIWTLFYVNIRYKKEGLKIHYMLNGLRTKKSTSSNGHTVENLQ
ncbi:MAG: glycerophosphoryl diester phosphodiesterase membrane domain-containing protein [Thermotaleaceae bacterium]